MRYIRALKNDRVRRKFVKIGSVHAVRTFTDDRIRAQLVGEKYEQVRFAWKFCRLGPEARTKSQTRGSKRSRTKKFATRKARLHMAFRSLASLHNNGKFVRARCDATVDLSGLQCGNYFRAAAIILFRRALRRFAAFR